MKREKKLMLAPLNHVGVTVTDLDRAIQWYSDVLGFQLLMGPLEIDALNPTIGQICRDIFGDSWQYMRQAHMSMTNGIGLEVFEFVTPKAERRENNFEYWKNGFFHICFPHLCYQHRCGSAHQTHC